MPSDKRAEIVHLFASTQNLEELQGIFAARPDLMKALDDALAKVATDVEPQAIPAKFQRGLAELMKDEELFLDMGNMDALEREIKDIQQILTHPDFASAPIKFRTFMFIVAAGAYTYSFETWKRASDLDQSIINSQQALKMSIPDLAERARVLYNLGTALRKKHLIAPNLDSVNQAIECLEEAVKLTSDESHNQTDHLNNLGAAYADRYEISHDRTDTEHAIACWEHVIGLVPYGSKNWTVCLNNLASILGKRFGQTKEPGGLDPRYRIFPTIT